MQTEVIDRPVFKSFEYLQELVRRNKRRAEDSSAVEATDPPPMPSSSFVLDDEIIACEVES